jgi:hypothetical protein
MGQSGALDGPRRHEVATLYAVIRAYAGDSGLADTLAEHEGDIRQVIGGIAGFKACYLLKLAEGTSTVSVFENKEVRRSRVAPPLRGSPRTCRT